MVGMAVQVIKGKQQVEKWVGTGPAGSGQSLDFMATTWSVQTRERHDTMDILGGPLCCCMESGLGRGQGGGRRPLRAVTVIQVRGW